MIATLAPILPRTRLEISRCRVRLSGRNDTSSVNFANGSSNIAIPAIKPRCVCPNARFFHDSLEINNLIFLFYLTLFIINKKGIFLYFFVQAIASLLLLIPLILT